LLWLADKEAGAGTVRLWGAHYSLLPNRLTWCKAAHAIWGKRRRARLTRITPPAQPASTLRSMARRFLSRILDKVADITLEQLVLWLLAAGIPLGVIAGAITWTLSDLAHAAIVAAGIGLLIQLGLGITWWALQIRPRLEFEPSGGLAVEVTLGVRNRNGTGLFRAECRILKIVNDPNERSKGVQKLKWVNGNSGEIRIPRNETENLLIATFSSSYEAGDRVGKIGLISLRDGQTFKYATAIWIGQDPSLPDCQLEIRFFREGTAQPRIAHFSLSPENWTGPLRLVQVPGPRED
jgi:hypothetical protein